MIFFASTSKETHAYIATAIVWSNGSHCATCVSSFTSDLIVKTTGTRLASSKHAQRMNNPNQPSVHDTSKLAIFGPIQERLRTLSMKKAVFFYCYLVAIATIIGKV